MAGRDFQSFHRCLVVAVQLEAVLVVADHPLAAPAEPTPGGGVTTGEEFRRGFKATVISMQTHNKCNFPGTTMSMSKHRELKKEMHRREFFPNIIPRKEMPKETA